MGFIYLRHFLTSLLLLVTQARHVVAQPGSDPDVQTCNTCCQGTPGQNGTPGSAGIPGSNGNNGSPGRDGIPGRDGMSGRDGMKGDLGFKGDRGDVGIGIEGMPGPEGPSGERGERGIRGLPGKVGPIGLSGEVGMKGDKGDHGSKGEPTGLRRSAFSAQKTAVHTSTTPNEELSFDEARVNIGGHFDLNSSRFTCQIPGTYFFAFSLYAIGPGSPDAVLRKDGVNIAYARSAMNNVQLQLCSSTMVHLDVGNQVWIEFSSPNEGFDCTDEKCQFSGYLVYEN
ncbi:uncharacterized protein [Amphiura filiformis]|uniref:uncharacterized protein n=1 Tax=Amphiura filiformis TaxID=82378 RepID=UPI003B214A8B